MTKAEKLIQQGMQEGMQEGRQEGIQEGMQQGIQQGMQEGPQRLLRLQGMLEGILLGTLQGIQEREIRKAREVIVVVLEARFGHIPSSVRKRLAGISDQAALKDLLRKAAIVASVTEWESRIPESSLS